MRHGWYSQQELCNWVEAMFTPQCTPSSKNTGTKNSCDTNGSTTETQTQQGDRLRVYLTEDAARWLWGYVHSVSEEIGGFGYCTQVDSGIVVVDTVLLAPQVVSSGSVDFTDEAMVHMVQKAAEDDRSEDARFSWHSHAGMGVSWSQTDEEGIRDYRQSGMPWLVSMVVNHKGDSKARLDVFDVPLIGHAKFKEGIEVRELRDRSLDERIEKQVEQFVTKKADIEKAKREQEKADKEANETDDDKSKAIVPREPVRVDSTMEPREFILWQKYMSGDTLTDAEEAEFEEYLNGSGPSDESKTEPEVVAAI